MQWVASCAATTRTRALDRRQNRQAFLVVHQLDTSEIPPFIPLHAPRHPCMFSPAARQEFLQPFAFEAKEGPRDANAFH